MIGGVDIRNLVVPMPAAGEGAAPTGSIGVEQLDRVRFTAVVGAVRGDPGTRITGTASTGARQGQYTLDINLVGDKKQTVRLDALLLTDTELRTSGNGIRIRRAEVSGTIQRSGDVTRLTNVTVPDLDVAALDWAASSTGRLTARGSTHLEGVAVSATYTSTAGARAVTVQSLRINRIRSDDLHYVDGDLDLHLGRFADRRDDLLDVRNVTLSGLEWSEAAGITAGTVDAGTLAGQHAIRAEFSGALGRRLRVSGGSLDVQTLRVEFFRGGRIVARARGVSGDIGLDEQGTDGWNPLVHAAFEVRDTGAVEIRDGAIEIGGGDSPGLDIASITVDQLDWRSDRLKVRVPPGAGAISLANTRARVRVELNSAADARRTGSRLRRIVIRELFVEEITADGIEIELPQYNVTFALPAAEVGRLRRVRLTPGEGAQGFVIEAPATPTGNWNFAGGLRLSDVLLPRVTAEVRGRLRASVSAGFAASEIGVDLFSGGGVVVDLTNPTLRAIRTVFDENPGHTLSLRGFDADDDPRQFGVQAGRVRYDSRARGGAGQITATDVAGAGLWYRNEAQGVYVQVEHFRLPGQTQVDATTFAGVVPELIIEDARFTLDFSRPGRSASSDQQRTFDQTLDRIRPYFPVINSLQGTITTAVYLPIPVIGPLFPRLRIGISNGAINYQETLQAIRGTSVRYLLQSEMLGDTLIIGIPAPQDPDDPQSDPDMPRLIPLVSWRLPTDQVAGARDRHLIRIVDLLNPERDRTAAPSTDPSWAGQIQLWGLVADLSVRSTDPIPVPIDTEAVTGGLVLSPNALVDLHAEGNLPGPGGLHTVNIAQINVKETDLLVRGAGVATSGITVTGVHDTEVRIGRGNTLQRVSGQITSATARNLRWNPAGPVTRESAP